MYYLQSRYYNPEWGRFINLDNYGGQIGELLSHNGYVYCQNNPINMIDENGNLLGLKYNDNQYYYIKNGQNDIIGILDSGLAQLWWTNRKTFKP